MQLDAQDFIALAEESGSIAFFDIECTSLGPDYGSVLVASLKPWGKKPMSFSVVQPGDDLIAVSTIAEALKGYKLWVSYYGKGFDVPFLQARLLRHGLPPLQKSPHADMYFSLRRTLNLSRGSMAHIAAWLKLPEQKMGVSADVWSQVIKEPQKHLKTLIARCESDCAVLEKLWHKTRHLIKDIKR
jgi:uncharacterized protein YprB with RNaseH-like and TPR domain